MTEAIRYPLAMPAAVYEALMAQARDFALAEEQRLLDSLRSEDA